MGALLRQRWLWIAAGTGLAVVVVVAVWFQPQTLFIDDRVDQDIPTAEPPVTTSSPDEAPTTSTRPSTPVDLATGEFTSLAHTTSGAMRVLDPGDGRRFVRFENFETSNGPDLFVYLSTNPTNGPEAAFDDDYLDLGALQGNIGDQNYQLPTDTDLTHYTSVVIWCDRFDAAFGAAELNPQ